MTPDSAPELPDMSHGEKCALKFMIEMAAKSGKPMYDYQLKFAVRTAMENHDRTLRANARWN